MRKLRSDSSLPDLPYSPGQLFWISYGQNFCAKYEDAGCDGIRFESFAHEKFRVNGVAQNSEEFARDFSCPTKSPMNPEEKCTIWSRPGR